MSQPLVVANWKMNPQKLKEAKEIASVSDEKNVVLCPPFVFLLEIKKILKKANTGAQNCFSKKRGAFTGEISPLMLKEAGCKYVILGHSERRELFEEDTKKIREKIALVLSVGISPIVCIGEKRKSRKNEEEVKKQLVGLLKGTSLKHIIVAYEPRFAIGTGNSCPLDVAKKRLFFIKKVLQDIEKKGEKTPVLYGGSVNAKNASLYIKDAGFQGLLIGGVSLKKESFSKLLKNVTK